MRREGREKDYLSKQGKQAVGNGGQWQEHWGKGTGKKERNRGARIISWCPVKKAW